VGDMLPICKATKHLMPDYFGSGEEISFLSEIPEDEILLTRRQKEEDPDWQEYLAEEALAEMAQEAEKAEKRDAAKLKKERIENKKKGKENNVPNEEQEETLDEEETLLSVEAKKSVKMIRTVEAIPAGTKMYNFIDLVRPSNVEIGLICAALEEFSISPYVGGKSSQGYGRVSMSYNLIVDGNMSNMEDQAVVINQNEIFALNSPLLQECLAAYEEWLANVKREDVLYYEFEKKGKNKGE
jgi:CRISPR type IV-associated protein Csf2